MKKMKKLASFVLALIMVLSMSITVFAAGEGTITINNAQPGETYSVYKIFDVTYDKEKGVYSYTIAANSDWLTDVQAYAQESEAFTLTMAATGELYVVTPKANFEEADAAAFAAYLAGETTGKTATATKTVDANASSVEFTNLDLGYYFVDTTLGTLCFLSTTDPSAEITEKNPLPTVEKTVEEDSTNTYGESNTAQIGDTVNFKTVITAQPGAEKYVLHDTMETGLTLLNTETHPITVKAGETTLIFGTDYTLTTTGMDDGCTFEISFAQTYLDTIKAATEITVTYSAILNEKAEISVNTNDNTTWLTYGNASKTEEDKTQTITYTFDIVKTDSDNMLLDGAEFELYDAEADGNKITLVAVETPGAEGVEPTGDYYRVATTEESSETGFTSAVIKATDGRVTVKGLDAGEYWLEETKAPAGYNKLSARQKVEIINANISTTMTPEATTWAEANGGVHIINKAGALLPDTGGMGTTLFYVIGGVLVFGAVVLLVTKKRMNAAK